MFNWQATEANASKYIYIRQKLKGSSDAGARKAGRYCCHC